MKMDSFIDKITQKFSGGDVIRANSEADAKELEAARAQMAEYDKLLSEMRRLNLKCVETNEITNQLVASGVERLEEYKVQGAGKDYSEDINTIKESLKEQEDFIHKENVRVYRNVQAAVVEELKLQTEALSFQNKGLEKKVKGIKTVSVVSLIFNAVTMIGVIAYLIMNLM